MEGFKPIRGMKIKMYGKRATILYVRARNEFLVGFDEPWRDGHDGDYSCTRGYVPSRYAENNRCWWASNNEIEEILTNKLEVL